MRKRLVRFSSALTGALILLLANTRIAFADGSAAPLDDLLTYATSVYRLLRAIVVPFMILSIASYGFDLFQAAFLSRHEISVDEIKKKALYMVLAAGLICGLPTYIGWAASVSSPFGWQPPTAGEMDGPGLQYYADKYGTSVDDGDVWTPGSNQENAGFAGDPLVYYQPGSHKLSHHSSVTNDNVSYWLHIPQDATTNMPIVVFLHGSGERNRIDAIKNYGLINSAKNIYSDKFPFIAIYPSLKYTYWHDNNFLATLKTLIDSVVTTCNADKNKIIITGHSLGSMGTWDFVSQYGTYFSCAVPVSYQMRIEPTSYQNLTSVPIWGFCGNKDSDADLLGPMKANINTINAKGGNAKFTELSCGHAEAKDQAYTKATFEWMLSQ